MSAPVETVNDASVEVPKEEGFRVYIGNLSFKATEEQVQEFAAQSGGEILSVVLPKRFKRPSGFAFVHYKTEDEAKHAIEALNDKEIDGRPVSLQLARSKEEQAARRETIIEKRDAARAAREQKKKEEGEKKVAEGGAATEEGEDKPKKKRPAKKTSRRRVPGQEDEEAEGEAAGEVSETPATKEKAKRKPKARKPREARIDSAEGEETTEEPKKPRQPRLQLTGEQSANTIFVANLPFTVDDDALAAIFTNLSIRVRSAKVVSGLRRGRGGRRFHASRGFGFVEVEDPAQQKEAVEKVEGSLIGDRKISAKVANEMKPIEQEEAAEAANGEEVTA